MLSFLKRIFYNKECYNCNNTIDKINCIKKKLDVKPYELEYMDLEIKTLEINITDYINTINDTLISIDNRNLNIKKITENNVSKITFGKWFTNSRMSIINDTDELWFEFLNKILLLNVFYNKYKNSLDKPIEHALSIKIRPYIINLEHIVNTIIENQIKDK